MKNVSISVVGLGKLGLCTAACFADKGFRVIGVDVDMHKIDDINRGVSPIQETNLDQVIKRARQNLHASMDYDEAVLNSDVTFIVVATPSLADGSFSNEYLEKALHCIGESLKKKMTYHVVVITSTVMPQTTEKVGRFLLEKISGKICGKDFGLAYNPEFIALGSVIHDFLNPDMILIGEMHKRDGDLLELIYKKACENTPYFARMSTVNAEITKISLNCYITTKITFANSVASICEKVKGADAGVVLAALGKDTRIGAKYLKPGLGYGGPCFPRDNVAFSSFARKLEATAKLAEMVDEVNRDQIMRVINALNEIVHILGKEKKDVRLAMFGLSYKPNTPIIEDAQAIEITQMLVNEGYPIMVYDPQAQENARGVLGETVRYAKNLKEGLAYADIGIITVPWSEFSIIDTLKVKKKIIILDCWRMLREKERITVRYLGVGSEAEKKYEN